MTSACEDHGFQTTFPTTSVARNFVRFPIAEIRTRLMDACVRSQPGPLMLSEFFCLTMTLA